ncbi:MAG: peptidase S24, partial [Nitrospina sp.]|nr:peptidase S24 [Nitrospina sp.]
MGNKMDTLSLIGIKPNLSHNEWPVFTSTVSAGFPSPADDYIENHIDLNEYLVQHKAATFFLRVQ